MNLGTWKQEGSRLESGHRPKVPRGAVLIPKLGVVLRGDVKVGLRIHLYYFQGKTVPTEVAVEYDSPGVFVLNLAAAKVVWMALGVPEQE